MKIVCLLAMLVLLSACWTDTSGTRHVVIVGVGVVSVNDTKPSAATVTRFHAVGIAASNEGGTDVGIGYSSAFITAIPSEAEDVRIEASAYPFAPIKIELQKAKLEKPIDNKKGTK